MLAGLLGLVSAYVRVCCNKFLRVTPWKPQLSQLSTFTCLPPAPPNPPLQVSAAAGGQDTCGACGGGVWPPHPAPVCTEVWGALTSTSWAHHKRQGLFHRWEQAGGGVWKSSHLVGCWVTGVRCVVCCAGDRVLITHVAAGCFCAPPRASARVSSQHYRQCKRQS
jgi:hypothetical protein